jgi:hypothetical protein
MKANIAPIDGALNFMTTIVPKKNPMVTAVAMYPGPVVLFFKYLIAIAAPVAPIIAGTSVIIRTMIATRPILVLHLLDGWSDGISVGAFANAENALRQF